MKSSYKHVLLTGGSRGIGLTITRRLLASNYRVTALSRSITEELGQLHSQYGDRLFLMQYDAAKEKHFRQLTAKVEENGPLYALVNNAAIAPDGLLITLPEVSIEETLTVNLRATILLTRSVARSMVRSRSGRIITVSSVIAQRASRGLSVYAATKAGLEAFSRCLALELGPRNINVNVVSPGHIETDMTRALTPEQQRRIRRRMALPRDLSAEDVANSVTFLLSEDAAALTGIRLTVDGGSSL